MEYKLVPVASDLPQLTINLPSDIVVGANSKIVQCLTAKGCSKDKKGRFKVDGHSIPNSSYDDIVAYLSKGKGKKPRGLKKVMHSVNIPKRLLPKIER